MRIVFMGTPSLAAITLSKLLAGPDEIVGVVTQPDRPSGRGQKTIPSPARGVAEEHGKPVIAPEKMRDPAFLDQLQRWSPDLIVVVAYGRILPQIVLDLPLHGCVNVHYSLLPKYRGAAPMQWALIEGERVTGVTTMYLVAKMDAGPVLLQKEVPVAEDETAASLEAKLVPVGAELLLETIAGIKDGSITAKEQDESQATYASMLKREDGAIDWRRPAVEIERRIRAFNPWPSAFSYWEGKLVKIHRARVLGQEAHGPPGEVVKAEKRDLWFATGEGILCPTELQVEGKKKMSVEDFLRGARLLKGMRFELPQTSEST